jgi:hypothetical protein
LVLFFERWSGFDRHFIGEKIDVDKGDSGNGDNASFHEHIFRTVKSLRRVDCDESSLDGTSARICGVKSAAENRFYQPLLKNISKRTADTSPPDAISLHKYFRLRSRRRNAGGKSDA